MADLDLLDVGMVFDMIIEQVNDTEEWDQIATQSDFDKF